MSVDDRLQEMLERLGRTLGNALADSEAAAEVVERVRREGLSLYLVLEPRRNEDGSRGIRLVPVEGPSPSSSPMEGGETVGRSGVEERSVEGGFGDQERSERRRSAARLRRARLRAQPQRAAYRLDQSDVDFLRTLGIDPSRTGRSKPGRSQPGHSEPDRGES